MRYTIITVLSAICLLTACSDKGEDMFEVPDQGYTLFKADFEDIDLAGEKSAYVWMMEKGIGVFGSEGGVNEKYVLKKAYEGKPEGEFYGPLVCGDSIRAYYPYAENFSLHDGALAYSLPASQTYSVENTLLEQFDRYTCYAYAFKDEENGLKFHYMSGLLSVKTTLSETATFTSMKLTSPKADLAGVGKVASDLSLSFAAGGLNSVEVDFGKGIRVREKSNDIAFPFVLPAGKYRDLKLVMKSEERDDILVRLDSLEVRRVTAGDFMVTEVEVGPDGLGGYKVVGGIEFNYVTTKDNTELLDKFEVVGGLDLVMKQ